MKKLISILAALALVGSLAAQKRKAPAKPAAKPVHEAVKAPAAPAIAVAPVAPAEHKASKGIGLFIEGRGTYTLGAGTSSSYPDGAITATSSSYLLPNTGGFGGGASIGYQLLKGLNIVGSFDYRNIQSRKWSPSAGGVAGTLQNTTNTMVLGLGLRPQIDALGGTFYAGFGFAYVLPTNSTTELSNAYLSGAGLSTLNFSSGASQTVKQNMNAGIGAYAELGYNYSLTANLYIGVGFRAVVATANNDGKSTDVTTTVAGSTTNSTTNNTSSPNPSDSTQSAYKSTGITDMGVNVNVGVRF